MLNSRASGLSPDNKQKISMGRGLVREDVNVVMFDQPLTVIDPYLKWNLRSKLKELHQRVRATMIYVTHDQSEALTFADQVVVMQEGEVVQSSTPVELFDRPAHTFVGHFIGSPGMNVLPCDVRDRGAFLNSVNVALEGDAKSEAGENTEIGVRPEFVSFGTNGIAAVVSNVSDVGRHNVVEVMAGDTKIRAIVEETPPTPGDAVHLNFRQDQTRLYRDGWIASAAGGN